MRSARSLSFLLLVLIAVGCSTHKAEFEEKAPPRPLNQADDLGRVRKAAGRLIQHYQRESNTLPTEALAPLAQASALLAKATGAPGARAAARTLGITLLDAEIRNGGRVAFFSSQAPRRADTQATIAAANSLVDVYSVTGDHRLRSAIAGAARALTSDSLGWTRTESGFAIRAPNAPDLYSVVLTAETALFLERASNVLARPATARAARDAFRFVEGSQAAVGRWYEYVGAKQPMMLDSWATTLLALALASHRYDGIVGGGVEAVWADAFRPNGVPLTTPLVDNRGLGVSSALLLFQKFGDRRHADLAYGFVLDRLREDGTVELASADDSVAQGYYALAFAFRAAALEHRR